MKRFYKTAEAGPAPGGFAVRLDGKAIKTPMQHSLIFPNLDFARAVANEWQAQGEHIAPNSMPLMQLASTMLDKVTSPADRKAMQVEVLKYGASDLLCYFATHPQDLVKRQEAAWLPLLKWLKDEYGAGLEHISGIRYHNQPEAALEKLNAVLTNLDAADFTVAQAATALTGSLVIALALASGYLDGEAAAHAATIDEVYQLEKWGEDKVARERLDMIRAECTALQKFRELIRTSS